jgi:hypothetical protein
MEGDDQPGDGKNQRRDLVENWEVRHRRSSPLEAQNCVADLDSERIRDLVVKRRL